MRNGELYRTTESFHDVDGTPRRQGPSKSVLRRIGGFSQTYTTYVWTWSLPEMLTREAALRCLQVATGGGLDSLQMDHGGKGRESDDRSDRIVGGGTHVTPVMTGICE